MTVRAGAGSTLARPASAGHDERDRPGHRAEREPHDPDEEMPRARLTRRAHDRLRGLRRLLAGVPVLRAAPDGGPATHTWRRIDDGDPFWLAVAAGFELLSFARLRAAVPHRVRARRLAHRLARELPDHDGRAGRDAPVRRRRRGRHRADRVGAAPLGHGRARRSPAGWWRSWCCCTSSTWATLVMDGDPAAHGRVPRQRAVRVHGRAGRAGRASCIVLSWRIALVPGRLRAAPGALGGRAAQAAGPAGRAAWPRCRPRWPRACATALALMRARDPGLLGALAWWAFDIAVLWACFHAFGDPPSKAVIVMAYFIGHARQPAAAAGRHRRRRGRHDRRADRLRRARRAWPSSPCWPTVRSRSGCPRSPGAIAYLQLRRTVSRWREERAAAGDGGRGTRVTLGQGAVL